MFELAADRRSDTSHVRWMCLCFRPYAKLDHEIAEWWQEKGGSRVNERDVDMFRAKICPFLLRLSANPNRHTSGRN